MDTLLKKNSHERDKHISFEEGPHIYTIDGNSDFMSVTTWNHSHFDHFDADKIIAKMMNSPHWKRNKYNGMTSDEIKNQWEDNRNSAATAGTEMHLDIERYYNGLYVNNESVEYKYFENFVQDCPGLKPYRTEWMIWDNELKFAGSIDMVFENIDGTLMIYDWKRSKEIQKYPKWNKYSHTECVNHLPDTNFWHYSLQLNTYKAILEKNYGKKVTQLALVCLHPDNANKNYQIINVPDLQNEVSSLFELRRNNLLKSS